MAPGEHLHGTSPRVVGHYAIVIVKIASEPALGPEAAREEVLSGYARQGAKANHHIGEVRFAQDSPLEGDGFEPPVPRHESP